MNYIISLLICSASMLAFNGCKTTKVSPEKYDEAKIYFGNGGGFSGKLNEFCMLDNGEVYQINPSSREADIRKVSSRSDAKNLFKKLNSMDLQQYPYDKPGNMFYWMKYHSKTDTTYLIWGDGTMEVDEKVIKVYDELVEFTRKQK